jgi:hypothetical protein
MAPRRGKTDARNEPAYTSMLEQTFAGNNLSQHPYQGMFVPKLGRVAESCGPMLQAHIEGRVDKNSIAHAGNFVARSFDTKQESGR